ncbi:MAG TPA: galactokinase family protein [Solirubrobacteraceae bacterium]|nr:galactokinase family protein [Solirubrobacteraceae bacterium]
MNLIGEHTDYNDGFVLPVALPLRTRVAVRRRTGARPESPYVAAVARVLGVEGFEVEIESDVPVGAGLGSSSALTVATARALSDAFGLGLSDRDAALAAHRAESVELGIGSGVMDQLCAALGREREALLIDCRSLDVRRVPLPPEAEVRVVDSGVRHSNRAAAGYRERVAECRHACELLGVGSLRDAASWRSLPPPLDRRVRHVVEENARVLEAAEALECGDLARLGALMSASHASQRDLYEVSVPEVDALVQRLEAEGALGARLTGGGFGGSVVALF